MKKLCENCKFWDIAAYADNGKLGLCRAHAPRLADDSCLSDWAATCPDDWCGEFVVKEQNEQ